MTRINVMLSAAIAIAVMSAFAPPAQAAIEYPWCAKLSEEGGGGARNCGFESYEQCMETVRGIGGYCELNPLYRGAAREQRQPAPKRKSGN